MRRFRLIDCERENERAEWLARVNAEIAERESVPWDWADYQAVAVMARYLAAHHITNENPVADVLERLEIPLEDEQFRAGLAELLRSLAG